MLLDLLISQEKLRYLDSDVKYSDLKILAINVELKEVPGEPATPAFQPNLAPDCRFETAHLSDHTEHHPLKVWLMWKAALERVLLRQVTRATWLHPRSPPAKVSLAPSLKEPLAQHSIASAEAPRWAQLRVRLGQAASQHPSSGEMRAGPCLVINVDICSLKSHFCSACNHTC